jgi:hypothetical protein
MAVEIRNGSQVSQTSESIKTYSYDPLIGPRDIRLIRFLRTNPPAWTLIQINLDKAPPYIALSYTWGTNVAKHAIHIDGQKLTVSENLHAALMALSFFGWFLWIDAICINQEDLVERSQQVGLMNAIYRSADSVTAWLGPEADDSQFAIETMERWKLEITQRSETTKKNDWDTLAAITPSDPTFYGPPGTTPHRAWLAIKKIWERSWWSRAWIVQEATLAGSRHLSLMCGKDRVYWDEFAVAISVAESLGRYDIFQAAETYLQSFPKRLRAFRLERACGCYLTLRMVLEHIRSYECGDDRDKVFAALGMAADVGIGDIIPDYGKSVEDTYIDVVKFIISASELHCLSFLGYIVRPAPGSFISPKYEDLPTWVPDWRTQIACCTINKQRDTDQPNCGYLFGASGQAKPEIKIDGRNLIVKGLCIDTVKSASLICDSNLGEAGLTLEKTWRESMPQREYINGESVQEVFDRVIATDIVHEREPYANLFSRGHRVDWTLIESDPLSLDSEKNVSRNYLQVAIKQNTFGRRIFWTAQGYLGIGPASMAEGDTICVFFGGHVLYVLRAADFGLYECIGECYVHSLMDGEVFARERVLEERFFTII